MKTPFVSIVIPAFNAQKTIALAIEGALNQDYPGLFEVIVVDDGSTDQTPVILKKFPAIKVIQQKNSGPACARNQGAALAIGEIIFFTDSDCIPEKKWVVTHLAHWNDLKIGAVAGSYGIANSEARLARLIHSEILYRHQFRISEFCQVFGSYNVSISKKLFSELGGFDVGYRLASGEDNDLSYRITKAGYRIRMAKDALVRHHHPESVRKYLSEQFRHGYWRAKMYQDHPDMLKGDGYTFWKDIAEVILVFIFFFSFIALLLQWFSLWWMAFSAGFLLYSIEFFFVLRFTSRPWEQLFFTNVLFLRAFSRTLGFSSGIWQIFFPKKLKISK